VAERFEAAGVAAYGVALRGLRRCRPGRPPVYRDGDLYRLDAKAFRISELGPPQKSMTLAGDRVLRITTEMLVRGSCHISRPLGDAGKLRAYHREGRVEKLQARVEADAWSLFAMYQYGRLHGAVRLRWRTVDERFAVAWPHWDEQRLYEILHDRHTFMGAYDVVLPPVDWRDPWAKAIRCLPLPGV
jgi:hypothetical protein